MNTLTAIGIFALSFWLGHQATAHDVEPIRVEVHKELPTGERKLIVKYFDTNEEVNAWFATKVATGCDVNVDRVILYPYGKLGNE